MRQVNQGSPSTWPCRFGSYNLRPMWRLGAVYLDPKLPSPQLISGTMTHSQKMEWLELVDVEPLSYKVAGRNTERMKPTASQRIAVVKTSMLAAWTLFDQPGNRAQTLMPIFEPLLNRLIHILSCSSSEFQVQVITLVL